MRRATSALFLSFIFIRHRQKDFPEARVMRHHRQLACAMMDIREEGSGVSLRRWALYFSVMPSDAQFGGQVLAGEMTFVSKEIEAAMKPRSVLSVL